MHWGLGPVFASEWLIVSRRWRLYALRASFVGLILAGMLWMWRIELPRGIGAQPSSPSGSLAELARVGERLYGVIVGVELTLILLIAPASTSGAVCLDKARGSLLQILATDLTNAEIVLGKLAVHLVPVIGLVLCTLPVLALAELLGGIVPHAMWGSQMVSLGVAVLGSTIALVFSVWGRKTHEVLLATYLVLILWLLLPYMAWVLGIDGVIDLIRPGLPGPYRSRFWYHPYELIYAPYSNPGVVTGADFAWFLAICLLLSGALALLAIAQIRAVTVRQASAGDVRVSTGASRLEMLWERFPQWPMDPSLDNNPVL